jgi:hypothetical protein
MKKLFFLIVTSIFTLASCSNNEVAEVLAEQTSIIGKWQTVAAKENGKAIVLSSCDLYGYLEFLENNNCVLEQGNYYGGKCNPQTTNGTYTFKDNILTYKIGIYESRSHITELTANSFKSTTYYLKDEVGVEEIPVNEQRTYTVERKK